MIRTRGVRQVLVFNWPKVVAGLVSTAVGVRFWHRLPTPLRLGVLGTAFWTPVSLLASWWVYDLSPLRRWRLVADALAAAPTRVLLVVAGFDEVSPVLRGIWPDAGLTVVDVVTDPEPSVRRARRWYPAQAPVVGPGALDADGPYDLVLFAQSAHELRDPVARATLFASARSAVSTAGNVVLVEHLRDLPNVIAFGPGAWHFTRRGTWLDAFADAGLRVVDHRTVTPLVHCWTLAR